MSIEDFIGYIEVDPNNKITVTSSKIDVANLNSGDEVYVKKDKGASHFGDFEHLVEGYADNQSDSYIGVIIWGMTNGSNTSAEMNANNEGMYVYLEERTATVCRVYLIDRTNDNSDYSNLLSMNTLYYFTIERSGTTLTCKIYSDSARTVLVDTLTITCGNDAYRYIFGFMGHEVVSLAVYGYIQNLDLQEAVTITPVAGKGLVGWTP